MWLSFLFFCSFLFCTLTDAETICEEFGNFNCTSAEAAEDAMKNHYIDGSSQKCLRCPAGDPGEPAAFYNKSDIRFNQLQRLRIIGNGCICGEEVMQGYMKLLYLYSCIFQKAPRMVGKDAQAAHKKRVLNFENISKLDAYLQKCGRASISLHTAQNTFQLKLHLLDFIEDLIQANRVKVYRRYAKSKSKGRHWHAVFIR